MGSIFFWYVYDSIIKNTTKLKKTTIENKLNQSIRGTSGVVGNLMEEVEGIVGITNRKVGTWKEDKIKRQEDELKTKT